MLRLEGVLLLCLVVVSAFDLLSAGNFDTKECSIWSLVIDKLKGEEEFNITCSHNEQCSGFMCNGSVQLRQLTPAMPVSFGATFQPCTAPKQLNVTTKVGDQEFTETFTIIQETQRKEFNLSVKSLLLTRIVFNISLQLVENNQIGLELNTSVQTNFSSQFNYSLIPYLTIRIPDCVVPTTVSVLSNDSFTGKTCQLSRMHGCGTNQSCSNATSPPMCVCIHDLVWNNVSQQCGNQLPNTGQQEYKQSNVVVVVACTLVSFVAIVIVLILVIKCRRYRQRYGQHELLINNEGSDRDLDGDSPMLNG